MDHVVWSQKWVIRTPDGQYITAVSGMDAPHVLSDFTLKEVVLHLDRNIINDLR